MLYKKQGIPEETVLVLCTVNKILPHSIFVTLDEYENKEGMIHISEIAPGRIRNIRDYVRENKKIVCKVLKINIEKGHIDLSLRRVNDSQKAQKINEYKQEEKSEKLLETVSKKLKLTPEELKKKAGYKLIENFGTLNNAIEEIVNNKKILEKLNLDKNIEKALLETIEEKIKPVEIKIDAILKLKSYSPNGIEIIKEILFDLEKEKHIKILYVGAERYRVVITSKDYKTAESLLKEKCLKAVSLIKSKGGEGEFIRKD